MPEPYKRIVTWRNLDGTVSTMEDGTLWEAHPDPDDATGYSWFAGWVDHADEGRIHTVVFSCPNAKERAQEYADWMNAKLVAAAS